jgi:hypothetical protein
VRAFRPFERSETGYEKEEGTRLSLLPRVREMIPRERETLPRIQAGTVLS